MALELQQQEVERIKRQGAEAYPNECCGMLLGKEQDGRRVVLDILPLPNAREDSPRNRFLILPEDFVKGDQEARKRGLDILGFYHSHPDHPAWPSEFDREHAWPWYIYVILAVWEGIPRDMTGWLLTQDRTRFLPEALSIK